MNEYNAVHKRHPHMRIANLKVDNPVLVRGLVEELAVKRLIRILFILGLGALLLEEPRVVETLQHSIETAFASDDLSDFRQTKHLQASTAEELDYIRSFFPELQAPGHIEELRAFQELLVSQPTILPVAKSDVASIQSALSNCVSLLTTSLPQGNESSLTSAMMYETQLERCNNETGPRALRFLTKLGIFESPKLRKVSVEDNLARWKSN